MSETNNGRMSFEYGDDTYQLQFYYGSAATVYGGGRQGVFCQVTKLVITPLMTGDEIIVDAYCALNPEDRFNKETGRKLALTRALTGQPKAFRTAAWKAYHGRKGH
jgi:hypothetical protein